MEYYAALKKKKLSNHKNTWRKAKRILLNEKKLFRLDTCEDREAGKESLLSLVGYIF